MVIQYKRYLYSWYIKIREWSETKENNSTVIYFIACQYSAEGKKIRIKDALDLKSMKEK